MKKLITFMFLMVFLFASSLDKWKRDFVLQYNITFGEPNEKGVVFFFGEAVANVTPNDPAWVKEVALAYEKAMLNMQANFILHQYGRLIKEQLAGIYSDDSKNVMDFPELNKNIENPNQFIRIIKKAMMLAERKLDKALEQVGVNPEEAKDLTVEQKKKIFEDKFITKITQKAFGSMIGLVPFKVKVVVNPNGVTEVGIIAVQSPKTIQFAKDIANQRPTRVRCKPRSLKDILPSDEREYLNEIGLRYVCDSKGRPMLVSYGLWSVTNIPTNPVRKQKKINIAKEEARMRAESYISDFINTDIEVSNSAFVNDVSAEIAKKITNLMNNSSQLTQQDIEDIADIFQKNIKARSHMRLRGISEIYNWDLEDKGQVYVGSVVSWSYKMLNAANRYEKIKQKPQIESKKVDVKPKKKEFKLIERESKTVNSIEDF